MENPKIYKSQQVRETFIRLMHERIPFDEIERQLNIYINKSIEDITDDFFKQQEETFLSSLTLYKWYIYKKIAEDFKSSYYEEINNLIISSFNNSWVGEYYPTLLPKSKHLAYFYSIAQREGKLKEFKWKRIKSDLIKLAEAFNLKPNKFTQYYYQANKEYKTEYKLFNSILCEVKKLP